MNLSKHSDWHKCKSYNLNKGNDYCKVLWSWANFVKNRIFNGQEYVNILSSGVLQLAVLCDFVKGVNYHHI